MNGGGEICMTKMEKYVFILFYKGNKLLTKMKAGFKLSLMNFIISIFEINISLIFKF